MVDITTSIKAKVAIVGLGYVGLPLAQLFLNTGHYVYGIDVDQAKIDRLLKHQSYLSDFSNKDLKDLFAGKRFFVGTSFEAGTQADAIIICVPTPLDATHRPDLTYVRSAVEKLLPHLRKGQLLVLESTTYPGTTQEVLLPMVESAGWKVGQDVFLAYSPERIDPGQQQIELREIPKVIGGTTEACTRIAQQIYSAAFEKTVVVSSPKVAELTKVLENCQRLVNISFMNELAMLCEKMNLNLWEAIEAASTKPYGFTPYYPGPGIGGHCIPVDPLYLFWKAKEYGVHLQFIDAAHSINEHMPSYVVERTTRCLEDRKPLNESSVLVLGVTYKKDVNDLRESTALPIMKKLMELGITVNFHDPYISEVMIDGKKYKSFELTKRLVNRHDCTLILANHSNIPYENIVQHAPLVIDTRNATGRFQGRPNVVLL